MHTEKTREIRNAIRGCTRETSSGMSHAKSEIWLERDDQQFGGSGGDWTIELRRDRFLVHVAVLPWMACDQIAVQFTLDDARFDELKMLLRTVMAGCPNDLHIVE